MSEPTPPVAVVIPVYNMARYLAPCLDSVLAQTYPNFRIFAVDDGSTDESPSILGEYAARHANLTVIRQSNKGLAGARNTGIRAALEALEHFDYVFFFDSDDLLKENTLSACVNAALTHRCDLVTCGVQCFDKNGDTPAPPLPKGGRITQAEAIRRFFSPQWTDSAVSHFACNNLYARRLLEKIPFDERFRKGEDQPFLVSVLAALDSAALVPENLYLYRLRGSSISKSKSKSKLQLDYFLDTLEAPETPDAMKPGLFDRAFNVWWQDLNWAYQTDDTDYVNELERIFPRLKARFALYPPKNKDLRRLRIHALGSFVLKLYFSLRKNKASSANATFFD